jgi:hypothetical protein
LLTTGHLSSCLLLLLAGGVAWEVVSAGRSSAGATPGHPPRGAAPRSCDSDGPLPRAGAQLTVRASADGLAAGGSLAAVRGRHPEDAHALWLGVLRAMPVDCVRVSGSVGRL